MASTAALIPIIMVVARLIFLGTLPSCGNLGSKNTTSGRPPLDPLLPSRYRQVSSILTILVSCYLEM